MLTLKTAFFRVIFLAVLFPVFANPASAQQSGKIRTLTAQKFEKKLRKTQTPALVDVRTPEEFSQGHLRGATNFNVLDSTLHQHASELDRKKPVFVYCKSGVRSMKAAEFLRSQGFRVYNLKGGITGWSEEGLPIVEE